MIARSDKLTFLDVAYAARRLQGVAHRTPVMTSRQADELAGAQVFFKCENFQRTGSFKFRGAYNALAGLGEVERRRGVVTFSSGNHGQAVAFAARLLGMQATIIMPNDAPRPKVEAVQDYGAELIMYNRGREDREALASRLAQERGLTLIPPYDHPSVIAGQGTVAKEFIEEVGQLDCVVVPVGGGGLISGCALALAELSPGCVLVGVEPEKGNDAQQSLRSGKIVSIDVPTTLADGARTQHLGTLTFPIMQKHVAAIETVTDDQLREQVRFFIERMKTLVEPTGCLAAAAVLERVGDFAGKRVGVIVSGGNADMDRLTPPEVNSAA